MNINLKSNVTCLLSLEHIVILLGKKLIFELYIKDLGSPKQDIKNNIK